ncbi:MoxR family ATPase [uncultured Porticoccus sp.]|uniref:AAA family ATPase n=1 Tax=uncultured Porticoccus sp. TaxID=1256050 RepID=UPI002606ED70|nr:MoxR family ATPase [uncultured Porticoccus sp.]
MRQVVDKLVTSIGRVLIGKDEQIRLAITCLFAGGHLLIEDMPGMGKTTLAQGLAAVLGLSYNRVQFTSDLLPADILGISVYDRNRGQFEFHPGPVFSQLLLADEINRTTPKTQSALLEAMAEGQVTVEGETRPLPHPFFVIATQNPLTQSGTYPLPESQLDRFLMRIELGYPDPRSERELLSGVNPRSRLAEIKTLLPAKQLLQIQQHVADVKVAENLVDYLQRLVQFTRDDPVFYYGLSPRGALAALQCARAWALIHGRQYVIPEDIQAVFPTVAGHRLRGAGECANQDGDVLASLVLNSVDIL